MDWKGMFVFGNKKSGGCKRIMNVYQAIRFNFNYFDLN